jgi:hypothetical protein
MSMRARPLGFDGAESGSPAEPKPSFGAALDRASRTVASTPTPLA